MDYNKRKYERDTSSLKRVKSKIKTFNSLNSLTRSQKLKIMTLITARENINKRIKIFEKIY